ncbi:MAG: cysteine synthase A [Vagococcus sp.]|uniref:cysteine synthase A n=1 Tax=Vagococcus sp. TaxID=1933889 RepID=UPI002FC80458
MKKIVNDITELIGETPFLKLKNEANEANVFLKLESFNPGGSVKDRIALSMVERAEEEGLLIEGGTIIEPTSGNTGIGLAMVGASKGYSVILVMPDTMSIERQKLMKAYGADIILTPGNEGMKGSIKVAKDLAEKEGYFMPLQFENIANPSIHEKTTAKEIISAFEGEEIAAFVAGVGTGGTISGVGKELKKVYPNIKIYAVEPEESKVLRNGTHAPHKIQGIGAGFIPKVLDTTIYDEVFPVSSQEAIEAARVIGEKDGLLVGVSSGAAIYASKKIAKKLGENEIIVTIAPDSGERYLSTNLYKF